MGKPKNTSPAEKFATKVLANGEALLSLKNNSYMGIKPGDQGMAEAIENLPKKS